MNLSKSNRKIFDNTLILCSRMIVLMLLGFYTTRIVVEELGVEDYGIYFLVGGVVAMFSFLNGSMAGAIQRWITMTVGESDESKLKIVFGVSLLMQIIIAALSLTVYETLAHWYLKNIAVFPEDRAGAVFWLLQISAATIVFQLINVPFIGLITAYEKMGVIAAVSMIEALVKISVCIFLPILSGDKLVAYALFILLGHALQFVAYQLYCLKRIREARVSLKWDRKIFFDLWRLTFWSFFGNFVVMAYTQGIALLINAFFGPAVNAAAGISSQAVNILNQFRGNIQQALKPQIFKTCAQKRYVEMSTLIVRSSKFSVFLMLIIAIPMFYNAELLLALWLPEVPEHSAEFFRLGIFIVALMSVREPLITAAMASGDLKKYQLVSLSIMIFVCPMCYVVYSLGYAPASSSLVLLIFLSITSFTSAFMLKGLVQFDFRMFVREVGFKAVLVVGLAFLLSFLIVAMSENGFLRLFLLSGASFISSSMLIIFIGLTSRERQVVLDSVKKQMEKMLGVK